MPRDSATLLMLARSALLSCRFSEIVNKVRHYFVLIFSQFFTGLTLEPYIE
jgi:hypothetical protein